MKNNISARLLATLFVSSVIAAGQARADFMNWSYSTSAVPPGFSVTAPNNGSGAVQLTPFTNAAGGASIPVLAYATSATSPVTFDAKTSTYALTLTITDNTTHDHKSLIFMGSIGGGLTPTSSSLVNTFYAPTRNVTLDGHVYTVMLPWKTALAGPTSPQQNLVATIRVDSAGPSVAAVPEPASLTLAALGAFGLASCGLRRRRNHAA